MKTTLIQQLSIGAVALALLSGGGTAFAGILVGTDSGNDNSTNVLSVISDYNAANDPDLITTITDFKKTDDDASFVFNVTNDNNGFSFFEADMTTDITSMGALHDNITAYFSYDGPENILFYSVKASSDFTLYTYMPGLNLLELESADHDISHVTFWTGPPGIDPFGDPVVPEPSTWILTVGGCAMIALRRFRRR